MKPTCPLSSLIKGVRWAEVTDLNDIMEIFRKYPETRHKRRDYVEKMIRRQCVIFERGGGLGSGVVWILERGRRKVHWGTANIDAGTIKSYGIASSSPGDGRAFLLAQRVFQCLDNHQLSFWVSMRAVNERSKAFYRRFGAKETGVINWRRNSAAPIHGLVMCRLPRSQPPL